MTTKRTCKLCDMTAMRDSDFCFYHDPSTTEEQKFKARSKGGLGSRKIPHSIDPESVLPIRNSQDLLNFYNCLLAEALKEEDVSRMIRIAMKVAPKLNDALALEMIENLNGRLEIIEAKKNGKLIENHRLLESVNDDTDA